MYLGGKKKKKERKKPNQKQPWAGGCVDLLISFEKKVFVSQPLGNEIVAAQSDRGESEVLGAAEGSEEITPRLAPPKK